MNGGKFSIKAVIKQECSKHLNKGLKTEVIYLKHVGILIRNIFDNDGLISGESVRNGVDIGIQDGLGMLWRIHNIMPRPLNSRRFLSSE